MGAVESRNLLLVYHVGIESVWHLQQLDFPWIVRTDIPENTHEDVAARFAVHP